MSFNFSTIYCDSSAYWQTSLQDPASITMEGILLFFNKHLLFLLTVTVIFVAWLLVHTVYCFVESTNKYGSKFVHSKKLKIVWTIIFISALVLLVFVVDQILDPIDGLFFGITILILMSTVSIIESLLKYLHSSKKKEKKRHLCGCLTFVIGKDSTLRLITSSHLGVISHLWYEVSLSPFHVKHSITEWSASPLNIPIFPYERRLNSTQQLVISSALEKVGFSDVSVNHFSVETRVSCFMPHVSAIIVTVPVTMSLAKHLPHAKPLTLFHGGAGSNNLNILKEFLYEPTELLSPYEVSLPEIDQEHLAVNSFESLLSNDFLSDIVRDIAFNYHEQNSKLTRTQLAGKIFSHSIRRQTEWGLNRQKTSPLFTLQEDQTSISTDIRSYGRR